MLLRPWRRLDETATVAEVLTHLNARLAPRELLQRQALAQPIRKVVTTANAGTLGGNDHTILADATAGAVTVTLPLAKQFFGGRYNVVKVDSSANAVTVARSGTDTIDGTTGVTLTTQWAALALQSDGVATWVSLSNGYTFGGLAVNPGPLIIGTDPGGTDVLRVGGGERVFSLGVGTLSSGQQGQLVLFGPNNQLTIGTRTGTGNNAILYSPATNDLRTYFAADATILTPTAYSPAAAGGLTLGTPALPWSTGYLNSGLRLGSDPGGGQDVAAGRLVIGFDGGTNAALFFGTASTTQFGAPSLQGGRARNTLAAKQYPLSGDRLFVVLADGWDEAAGGYRAAAGFTTDATEAWTSTTSGGKLRLFANRIATQVGHIAVLDGTSFAPEITGDLSLGTSALRWGKLWGQDADFGLTVLVSGDVTAGARLLFTTAASKILPGATSLSLRNTADSADNLLVTDAGLATLRNTLTISTGGALITGATDVSGLFRTYTGGSTTLKKVVTVVGVSVFQSSSSTVEASLATITVPAGTLTADGDKLRISARWFNSNANSNTGRIKFGGTYVATYGPATTTTGYQEVIVSRLSATTQRGDAANVTDTGVEAHERTAPGETLSGAVTIDFRGAAGTSGTISLDVAIVEYLPV